MPEKFTNSIKSAADAAQNFANVGSAIEDNFNASMDSLKNHEPTRDIVSGSKDLKNAVVDFGKSIVRRNSIIGMAKKNLFQFPVFVSSTVELGAATALNALLEQMYISYLQSAISINPSISLADFKSGNPLRKFKSDTDRYVEFTDISYAHDACHNVIVNESGDRCEFNMISVPVAEMNLIQETFAHEPMSEFDHFFMEASGGGRNTNGGNNQDRIKDLWNENLELRKKLEASQTDQKNLENQIAKLEKLADRYDGMSPDEVTDAKRILSFGDVNADGERMDPLKQQAEIDKLDREIAVLNAKIKDLDKLEDPDSLESTSRTAELEKKIEEVTLVQTQIENLTLEKQKTQLELNAMRRANVAKNSREYREAEARVKQLEASVKEANYRAKEAANRVKQYTDEHYNPNSREYRMAEALLARAEIDIKLNSEQIVYNRRQKAGQFIDNSKLQKLNSMQPLMMTVDLNVVDGSTLYNAREYAVGVKTHCRVIDASVLPDMAAYPIQEMDKLARKAKWKAGELKFFRDIVFKIPQKKQTAIDSKDPNRKWYRRLYELAHTKGNSRIAKRIGGSPDGLIPDATLVISKADVDNIISEKKIDLLKASTARKLCNELFLMAFAVVDSDVGSVKIMIPELNNEFDVYSNAALNKQLAMLDTTGVTAKEIARQFSK